ncbi:DUF1189 domain-containing protein [Rossellomorea vietnamensis]|uniref:DUF1189 domain-containing protein n=1 Tax=Rossellomorea vietnamensis TaxID=218284 RepID=A0A5D4P0Z7_9BACI|nr:DUF1189 domain-containing protein [Rossellomorea vietnamensis]TYS19478.1 DUF1189 domain-containing protein [Rossellomorea vietnamensis]
MNIFKQLYRSLYSPKDIASYRFQGIGKTILYVFLLVLVSILPAAYNLAIFSSSAIEESISAVESELPSFSIEDGALVSDSQEPVTVRKEYLTFVMDSTGSISLSELSAANDAVALLKDEFALVIAGQVQSYPYSMLDGLEADNEEIVSFLETLDSLKGIILFVFILILYLFSAGMTFIKVSIFALIARLFANALFTKLPYRQAWRITAYSITLSTIFFTVMEMLNTFVPASFFLDWIVTSIVLYLTIKEMPKKKKT